MTIIIDYQVLFNLLLLKSQKSPPSSQSQHVVVEKLSYHCRTAQHSTAQRNQPCTKQRSTYVPVRVRQRKQPDRGGESSSICGSLFSNPAEKSNLPGGAKEMYDHKQLVMIREALAFRCYILIYLSYIFVRCMHAASGLFSWSMELLAFACRQFARTVIMDLCPLHSHGYVYWCFLVSERRGRKPPAERSALYHLLVTD